MSEETGKKSFGILDSLKKLIFEDSPELSDAVANNETKSDTSNIKDENIVTKTPEVNLNQNFQSNNVAVTDIKQMKVKVLGMLEKMNESGLDFFEVWNAAAEMGSVDVTTIKAAYTSLKYVDKTLNKDKLISTGRNYAAGLKKTIDQETAQKLAQREKVEQNQVNERANLASEIESIEKNIADLKEKLVAKQKSLAEINTKYEPQLKDIDNKIAIGNAAVTEVIADIENTINIIEKNIN